MIPTEIYVDDEMGLLTHNIPYISLELTPEQLEQLKNKVPKLYELDGHLSFPIKEIDGNVRDSKMIFILFVDKGL
jgi:hypothetical protein